MAPFKRLFPKYETPFFRSLPPGFRIPLPWPWLGELNLYSKFYPEQRERLRHPWDDCKEAWRGYGIAVHALLGTRPYHRVDEFVIDTNYEMTGISYQLFNLPENSDYYWTMELFALIPLTTLELGLNVTTAEETGFSCFHSGLLK